MQTICASLLLLYTGYKSFSTYPVNTALNGILASTRKKTKICILVKPRNYQTWQRWRAVLVSEACFGCSTIDEVKNFYKSLDVLRVEGRSEDMVLLWLIKSHCLLILTYRIEHIHVSNRDEQRSLRVAYNAIFRKLFGYRHWESVTNLQHSLGRQTWEELVDSRGAGFLRRARMAESTSLVWVLCYMI